MSCFLHPAGCDSIFLAHLFPNTSFTGLDILKEHVHYAARYAWRCNIGNARFERGDASAPPAGIASRTFDLIFGIESFCHLDTDEKLSSFSAFAARALTPRGRIVIVDKFRSDAFEDLTPEVQQALE